MGRQVLIINLVSSESDKRLTLFHLSIELNTTETVHEMTLGLRMPIPKDCMFPPALKSLMERCWAQKPEDRPEFGEIVSYMENIDNQGNYIIAPK